MASELKPWRVGTKVPLNVYEGDRPVCQCHTPEDAARIVRAMNRSLPAQPCATCGGTKRVNKVYGTDYDCELSTNAPCPDCAPSGQEKTDD